jgi:hypothetical protein
MKERNVTLADVHPAALDAALHAALPGRVLGISTYGAARPLSIWLDDGATPLDETAATAIASAHDPVFLAADRPLEAGRALIQANGTDAVTITVSAPKPGAAAVTLLVAGSTVPVPLSGGLGAIQITSADPASIPISVSNPSNRSTDQITVEAQ